jgi:hypothetical protein
MQQSRAYFALLSVGLIGLLILGTVLTNGVFPAKAQAGTGGSMRPDALQTAFDCSTVSEIPLAECQALVDLYNSTNGPTYWGARGGWLTSTTPCTGWYGVFCSGGHVTRLNLDSNGLFGPLPSSLSNLGSLIYLIMPYNQLSGPIPPLPTSLRELNLQENHLSGPMPALPSSLIFASLGVNQLSGPIPALPPDLVQLILWGNQLDGPIPALPPLMSIPAWNTTA